MLDHISPNRPEGYAVQGFGANRYWCKAKALGLTVPPSLLARADEVIE